MRGPNSKALEARERKKAVAKLKKEEELKRQEDSKWIDNDKKVIAKLNRKADQEAKEELRQKKRQELKELEEQEKVQSCKHTKPAPKKLTRAEIALRQVQAEKKKTLPEAEDLATPNINHLLREEHYNALLRGQDIVSATGVDAVLEQLDNSPDEDRHPEKRLKAAYKAYEEMLMPQMREDYPGLKRSQLKDRIFRQWQKAPENPMNARE